VPPHLHRSPRSPDYAFLSNCHTEALVAPAGAIDWLCVPSFDAPSVFGSLLDREAGFFRFGPFAINHPAARNYDPGTNVPSPPASRVFEQEAACAGAQSTQDVVVSLKRREHDDLGLVVTGAQ
jgi:GH15 family glucan-1,4-alpha-glucosidase